VAPVGDVVDEDHSQPAEPVGNPVVVNYLVQAVDGRRLESDDPCQGTDSGLHTRAESPGLHEDDSGNVHGETLVLID
jgi:hypothetical protein